MNLIKKNKKFIYKQNNSKVLYCSNEKNAYKPFNSKRSLARTT